MIIFNRFKFYKLLMIYSDYLFHSFLPLKKSGNLFGCGFFLQYQKRDIFSRYDVHGLVLEKYLPILIRHLNF